MKFIKLLISLSTGVLLLSGCTIKDRIIIPTTVNQKSSTTEDLALYNAFVDKNDNWMFSPYSIKDAFSILYYGADDETRDEFKDILGIDAEVVSAIRDYDNYVAEQEK